LRSPLALAWRLQRGTLLAWTAGFALLGVVFGYIVPTVAEQLAANPQFKAYLASLGGDAGDAVFTLYMIAFAPVIALYAISAVLRMRSEEVGMRAEPVLSTAVGRLRWMGSHLVFAIIGPAVVLAALGIAAGLSYGLNTGDVGRETLRVLAAAIANLPAVWVMAGIAAALFGLLPRFAALSWATLVGVLLIELGGELQQVSQAVLDISPFRHVPRVLVSDVSAAPLIWLAAVATALTAVGLLGFRFRDVD
jgi:ABC-2 type transport system permease protein